MKRRAAITEGVRLLLVVIIFIVFAILIFAVIFKGITFSQQGKEVIKTLLKNVE